MSKVFKMIYINLVETLNLNSVNEAKELNIRDSSEVKLVLMGVFGVLFGILLYNVYDFLCYSLANKYLVLTLALLVSSFVVFISNLVSMEDALFRSNDVEMLYSLPLTKNEIVLSKLFNVYIRNLLFIVVINLPAIIVFGSYIKVTDLVGLLFFLFSLLIPLIPIAITAIVSYLNAYGKARKDKKLLYNCIKIIIALVLLSLLYLVFKDISVSGFDGFFKEIFDKVSVVYPLTNIFHRALADGNAFYVFLGLVLPVFVFYVFTVFLADSYIRLISILKGVRVNSKFVIGNPKNNGKNKGMILKEINYVLNDKVYFMHTIGLQIIGTIVVIIICIINPLNRLSGFEYIEDYMNMMMPSIIACFSSLCCTTISSLSLERDNLEIIRTLPISFKNVLVNKVIANILISLPFALLNVLFLGLFIDVNGIVLIISLIYAIATILFISVLGITLDWRFIDNKERDKNTIIRQRLITFVPLIVSAVIGVSAFVLPIYAKYYYVIGSYSVMEIVGTIICIGYMIYKRDYLLRKMEL